jgi:putative transposon-encoded protein
VHEQVWVPFAPYLRIEVAGNDFVVNTSVLKFHDGTVADFCRSASVDISGKHLWELEYEIKPSITPS